MPPASGTAWRGYRADQELAREPEGRHGLRPWDIAVLGFRPIFGQTAADVTTAMRSGRTDAFVVITAPL